MTDPVDILTQRISDVSLNVVSVVSPLLSPNNWNTIPKFVAAVNKETQYDYYVRNNSHENILKLVRLESKTVGTVVEAIMRTNLQLGDRTSSQNDGTFRGKKFEIKAARYWCGETSCKWQHLEEDHDYEYVLFVLIDFTKLRIWVMSKNKLFTGRTSADKPLVERQGEQGHFVNMSIVVEHGTEINSVADLNTYIDTENANIIVEPVTEPVTDLVSVVEPEEQQDPSVPESA